jgi:catechol 2,3-dioxygenase-like lactoylglutathione lyase family enzyme
MTAPVNSAYSGAVHLGLVSVVVSEYDPAISFFVDALGFELEEDSPAVTNDGRPKRWVVVRPPGARTGVLLARADGEQQASVVATKSLAGPRPVRAQNDRRLAGRSLQKSC